MNRTRLHTQHHVRFLWHVENGVCLRFGDSGWWRRRSWLENSTNTKLSAKQRPEFAQNTKKRGFSTSIRTGNQTIHSRSHCHAQLTHKHVTIGSDDRNSFKHNRPVCGKLRLAFQVIFGDSRWVSGGCRESEKWSTRKTVELRFSPSSFGLLRASNVHSGPYSRHSTPQRVQQPWWCSRQSASIIQNKFSIVSFDCESTKMLEWSYQVSPGQDESTNSLAQTD